MSVRANASYIALVMGGGLLVNILLIAVLAGASGG